MCTYLFVVIPEDVGWRFSAVLNCARKVYGAALVHVQVRAAQNSSGRYCNNTGKALDKWLVVQHTRRMDAIVARNETKRIATDINNEETPNKAKGKKKRLEYKINKLINAG
jgi:hypothetical protein